MSDTIDRAHLEQLGSRFGGAFLVQLIDLFIVQGRERIEAAQTAASAGDGKAVAAAAHALKSSAGNLGAKSLGERAANVERAGSTEQTSAPLVALVAGLSAAFDEACAALLSIRAAQGNPRGGAR
jgi:HPt (histidine-containing phosphotransfer) domain-containing protein